MVPLHICARRGDRATLDLLLAANTLTTIKTKDGLTALDIAKSKGFEDIYARLMRQRSSIPTMQINRRLNGSVPAAQDTAAATTSSHARSAGAQSFSNHFSMKVN
jgi:ankyrin repeat protein